MKNKIIHFFNSKFFEYILLTVVLVMGFTVRLYKINNPIADWHSWRQADTASVSRNYVNDGINLLLPKFDDISSIQSGIFNPEGVRMVEFPFYNAVNALLAKTFTTFSLEVWARLLTISIAVVTACFLYLIGKRLLGKWGGLLSAFFYLFIPFNIYFTRVVLPDPLGVMFGVIAVWAFLEFFESNKKRYFFLSALFFALAFLIKPYLGFYVIPVIYLAIKKYGIKEFLRNKKIIISSIVFMVISFIPFLLWRAWEGKFPEGIPFYEWAFNGNMIRLKPSWWYWIFGERLGHMILGSMGIVPFVFGVLNTRIKNLFIPMFLAGSFFYVVLVANANVMHDYYQILIIPSIALALASGTIYLWNSIIFNRILTRCVVVASVGVMIITGWNQIVGNFNVNHPEIVEAGNAIDRIASKDALVLAPYNGDTAFLYQTKRKGWPAMDDSIDNIIKKGASYYISVDLGSSDTKLVEGRFKTVEKTNKYIIIDLKSPLKTK